MITVTVVVMTGVVDMVVDVGMGTVVGIAAVVGNGDMGRRHCFCHVCCIAVSIICIRVIQQGKVPASPLPSLPGQSQLVDHTWVTSVPLPSPSSKLRKRHLRYAQVVSQ